MGEYLRVVRLAFRKRNCECFEATCEIPGGLIDSSGSIQIEFQSLLYEELGSAQFLTPEVVWLHGISIGLVSYLQFLLRFRHTTIVLVEQPWVSFNPFQTHVPRRAEFSAAVGALLKANGIQRVCVRRGKRSLRPAWEENSVSESCGHGGRAPAPFHFRGGNTAPNLPESARRHLTLGPRSLRTPTAPPRLLG